MLWLHLSNITYVTRLTGIPRAEFEIFKYALQRLAKGEKIKFCTYCAEKGFVELGTHQTNSIIKKFQIIEEIGLGNYYIKEQNERLKTNCIKYKCYKRLYKTLISFLKKIHILKRYLNIFEYPFQDGDTILSIGLNISSKDMEELQKIKKRIKLNIKIFCHDIIPITHPQFVQKNSYIKFNKYFSQLINVADFFYCNSNYTQSELVNYFNAINCKISQIKIVPLGSDSKINNNHLNIFIKKLLKEKFLLFVSSIEVRKNHQILYEAYLILINRKIKCLPKLLFVGQRGWMVDDLLKKLIQDERVRDKIIIIDTVNDVELSYLYKGCFFTLYPSYIEGYGLPVAESLRYGKYCLASNTSSLPEVGMDFIDYLNPYDKFAWANKLEFLLNNQQYIVDREKYIRDNYHPISWKDTAESVFEETN